MDDAFDAPAWLERERALLGRVRAGDRGALGELYDAFARPLYTRVLLPRLGDRALAEEALAVTFERVLTGVSAYEDRGRSVWHWVATIAVRQALDVHRRRAREGRALLAFSSLLQAEGEEAPEVLAPGEEAALAGRVRAVLAGLHPRYKRAIELRFFEERPRAACAEALEVTVSTFDVVMLRALRAFERAWQKEGHA